MQLFRAKIMRLYIVKTQNSFKLMFKITFTHVTKGIVFICSALFGKILRKINSCIFSPAGILPFASYIPISANRNSLM